MSPNNGLSPCNGQCVLDSQGFCITCLRTIQEIIRWDGMDTGERDVVYERIASRRQQRMGGAAESLGDGLAG